MTQVKHWQDGVNGVLGAWLLISPWALGYTAETSAMGNSIILGIALIALALGAWFAPRIWEEWTEGILGLWLIASPWLLGFSTHATTMRNAVLVGIVVVVLAAWTLLSMKSAARVGEDRMAH